MILGFIPALPDSYLIIDLSPFSFDIWLVCNDFPVITPLLIDALLSCNEFSLITPLVPIDALSKCNDFPVIVPSSLIDALTSCNDFPLNKFPLIVPSVLIEALSNCKDLPVITPLLIDALLSCNDFPAIVPSALIDAFITISFNILPFAIGTFADWIYKCSFSPNVKSSNELINTLPSNVVPFVIIFVSVDFKLNSISIIETHNW